VNRHAIALRANFVPLSVLLALLLTGSASAVTANSPAGMAGDVVAQMGAVRLTASDLKDFVARMEPETRRQALANPKFMDQLIQAEVARKAVLNEALAKKWQLNPAVVKQIGTAREAIILKSYLAAVTELPKSYPSDADIKAAYDLNRDKFLMPRQYHLAQIFVSSPPGDKNAAVAAQKAKELAAQTHARGARFDELARKTSQHKASAAKGGDIGWLVESQLQPAIRTKIAGMMKGDVSDPIRGDQGWHIVRLIDTKPAALRPLPEVRSMIVTALRQQKQQSDQLQYIKQMVDKTPVQLNQANLKTALKAAQ
jgi:peptidylprolyl isomerase